MKDRLLALEKESQLLEPSVDIQDQLQKLTHDYSDRFMSCISTQKAYQSFDKSVNKILDDPIGEEASNFEEIFQTIEHKIVPPGLNPSSGTHFGYIPGGGLFSSAIGDYITAITNRYAGVYFSSPGAVALETRLVNWMAELIGYPKSAGGFLSSGGSIANLTAIVTAREHAELKASDFSKAVVYLSEQAHHCVDKGLIISGMRECVKRNIPLDEHFRIKSVELAKQIQKDRAEGLIPWMIVASAGTTDVGAIDPLHEIAIIAQKEKLWLHVDAAYGGFFLLTDEGKAQLKGIELADSVVLDPHKGLFLPYGSGALVVKDVEKLAVAHRYDANYMQDTKMDGGMYSPAELSPELSKHFRGLRMWMPLKIHGVKAFRSALEEKRLLALYAWEKLNELEDIEVGPKPELTVFTFRWNPGGVKNLDELNQQVQNYMLADGRVFLSTTRINDEFRFRFVVLSIRTHLKEVEQFLQVFEEMKQKVLVSGL
ncbi:MAG: pyridoxal-dependent decarboxylase [Balneolaceae bacterium]